MPLNIQEQQQRLARAGVRTIAGDGVPTDSVTGVGEGCGKGSLYVDFTNGKLYINGGTAAAPVWKLVTSAS